jgi:hypothetical protein
VSLAALALALLLPAGARAQLEDGPKDIEVSQQQMAEGQQAIDSLAGKLQSDPQESEKLVERIMKSRLADRISGADNPAQQQAEIAAFIKSDPKSAAGIGVGLAQDDANGTNDFENAVTARVQKKLVLNKNYKGGVFGNLKKNAKDSGLLKKQSDGIAEEEQREILKSLFEGKGGQSARILTQQLDDKAKTDSGPGSVGAPGSGGLTASYYDRLSGGNLRGYSPQLQAMQSALNARRAPGSPKLIETGKLDFETLSYPSYGMKFDIEGLSKRLRYERNFALARLLGLEGRYKGEQLLDPAVEAKLLEGAAGKTLPPGFQRRLDALEKARAALERFQQAALSAKDPEKISRQLLMTLGELQKESARWITVASLEEEVQRLDFEKDFLTPELLQTINACPVPEAERAAFIRRGEEFQRSVRKLKADDEAAIAGLQGEHWQQRIAEIERALADAGQLRRNLLRNIDVYRTAAYRLYGSLDRRPGWRKTLDGYAESLLASSAYAKKLRSERRARELLKDVFLKIAAGNLDAAFTVLESYEPARSPAR